MQIMCVACLENSTIKTSYIIMLLALYYNNYPSMSLATLYPLGQMCKAVGTRENTELNMPTIVWERIEGMMCSPWQDCKHAYKIHALKTIGLL